MAVNSKKQLSVLTIGHVSHTWGRLLVLVSVRTYFRTKRKRDQRRMGLHEVNTIWPCSDRVNMREEVELLRASQGSRMQGQSKEVFFFNCPINSLDMRMFVYIVIAHIPSLFLKIKLFNYVV